MYFRKGWLLTHFPLKGDLCGIITRIVYPWWRKEGLIRASLTPTFPSSGLLVSPCLSTGKRGPEQLIDWL